MNEQDGKHVLGVSCSPQHTYLVTFFFFNLWFLMIITEFKYFTGESRNDT